MFDFDIGWENFSKTDPGVLFIVLMGIGTVFVGLVCLVLVCKLLGLGFAGKKQQNTDPIVEPPPAPPENKQELVAAISAAVAEELGTEVNGIRITSFKKL